MRNGMIVAVGLSALALSACGSSSNKEAAQSGTGGGGGTQTAAMSADPCALVTSDEVAAAIGEKIVRAQASSGRCTYETEDVMASSVTVEIKRKGAAEEMEAIKGANKMLGNIGSKLQGKEGAPGDVGNILAADNGSPGIGDESLFDASLRLHVRKGDAYIAVAPPIMHSRMSGGNPLLSGEQRRKMAIAVAQKAVSRL